MKIHILVYHLLAIKDVLDIYKRHDIVKYSRQIFYNATNIYLPAIEVTLFTNVFTILLIVYRT